MNTHAIEPELLNGASWVEAANADALALALAESVAEKLAEAIAQKGRASLVVSGGSTPVPVFQHLSHLPIAWQQVVVTLADERWVPLSSADSNERLVREHLLVDRAAEAAFVRLYVDDRDADDALPTVEQAISAIDSPFTVVIFGMGGDGHTASLFPDADGVAEALRVDLDQHVVIMRPASVPQARISLTLAALINSQHRFVHITGEGKRDVLKAALSDGQLPIAHVFHQQPEKLAVYWSP